MAAAHRGVDRLCKGPEKGSAGLSALVSAYSHLMLKEDLNFTHSDSREHGQSDLASTCVSLIPCHSPDTAKRPRLGARALGSVLGSESVRNYSSRFERFHVGSVPYALTVVGRVVEAFLRDG